MFPSNMEYLWEKLKDVPEEFHNSIAWYLLGNQSGDIDSDEWKEAVNEAIKYVRGIAG